MREKYIAKLSDKQSVDMSSLSEAELKLLHFEEENFAAREILRLPPFSEERKDMLKKGYDFAVKVMAEYLPASRTSQGTNIRDVKLVCKFIEELDNGGALPFMRLGLGGDMDVSSFYVILM